MDKPELTFEEFVKMCEDAGISGTQEELSIDFRVGSAITDTVDELHTAIEKFPAMSSAHEGYAVLAEEVDELWEHVKKKQGERDVVAMRKEAVQVAAMAIRFAADICHDEKGNN